jgi:hypothetical protein
MPTAFTHLGGLRRAYRRNARRAYRRNARRAYHRNARRAYRRNARRARRNTEWFVPDRWWRSQPNIVKLLPIERSKPLGHQVSHIIRSLNWIDLGFCELQDRALPIFIKFNISNKSHNRS